MGTKSAYLIFWMLIYVWAEPGLVQRIRDEIEPFARTTQPPQLFTILELPRLTLDVDGLVHSCPLLRSCFYETLRLRTTPTSIRSVQKGITVDEAYGLRPKGEVSQSFALEVGSIVAAPLFLHHHDPHYFENPALFRPSRFLESSEDFKQKQTVNEGMLRPWGAGKVVCPGRDHAEHQVLAFVAGILALWDFHPAGSKWVVPGQIERAVVSVPSSDIKIGLQPRKLS